MTVDIPRHTITTVPAREEPTRLHLSPITIDPALEIHDVVMRVRTNIIRRSQSVLHYSEALLEVRIPTIHLMYAISLTLIAFAGHEVGKGGISTLIGAVAGGKFF